MLTVRPAERQVAVAAHPFADLWEFTSSQRQKLLELVGVYVGYMDDGHAAVKLKEVEDHLDDTYFYWIGETKDSSAFYYRVHSPIVLIEYDAQSPLAYGKDAQMGGGSGAPSGQPSGMPDDDPSGMPRGGSGGGMGGTPTQQHIHTIIRTPNGNDYGVDLLKLHLETGH